jgi:Alpha/beta hydrolase domain
VSSNAFTRMRPLIVSAACATVLVAASVLAASASAQPTLTEIPATSGIHGYPYDAVPPPSGVPGEPKLNTNFMSLGGYTEHEFKMSGTTNVYRESGNEEGGGSSWNSTGSWKVAVSQSGVPYTTRLIVRYPTNPAKFNGTVVFEWMNDTTGGDQDPVWSEMGEEIVRQGYAYVGVTAQRAGMNDLVAWDPARYSGLGDSNDGQSYSVFTQAAEAVANQSATLLPGLTPTQLIGTGDSQSAFRVDTYVNAFQPITHAFTGFIAVGRAVTAAPLGNGLIALSPFPAHIRKVNNTTPFIQLNTQGDIVDLDAAAARQPDNEYLRTWEVPGAAHIDAHEATYEIETIAREAPTLPVPSCTFGTPISGSGTPLDGINQVNNMPLFQVEDAALMGMRRWLVDEVAAPHSAQISTWSPWWLFGLYDFVNSNQHGVGNGGIRMPDDEVPTENYAVANFSKTTNLRSIGPAQLLELITSLLETATETGSISNPEIRTAGLCLLSGYFNDESQSMLKSMYPTTAAYASKFKTQVASTESAGFMTADDAAMADSNVEAGLGPLQQPALLVP